MCKIKICGIKSQDEAIDVLNSGKIDFLGLIFAKSPRQISPDLAAKISSLAHEKGVKVVGVFGGIKEDKICQICQICALDAAQIYEPIDKELKIRLNLLNNKAWQVVSVGENLPKLTNLNADFILFDTKGLKLGGNGISFDWNLLKNIGYKFGIAGGLNASNIAKAASFNPYLLDINSGVEDENFIKIPAKIDEILSILKKKN